MPPSPGAAQTVELQRVLTAPLVEVGFDLEAVEVTRVGSVRVLRVAVDADGGLTLDGVAEATRTVNEVLETDEGATALTTAIGEAAYTLEVTSRGVDRPLTLPRHWRRNAGRLVKVGLADGSQVTGRITTSDDDPEGAVTLEVAGRERRVPYAEVAKALVQIEFNRPSGRTEPHGEDD
jgi:ribosome maturation factor RimP